MSLRSSANASTVARSASTCPPPQCPVTITMTRNAFVGELLEELAAERADGFGAVLHRVREAFERLDGVGADVDRREDDAARRLGERAALPERLHPVEPDGVVVAVPFERAPREVRDRRAVADRFDLRGAEALVAAPA